MSKLAPGSPGTPPKLRTYAEAWDWIDAHYINEGVEAEDVEDMAWDGFEVDLTAGPAWEALRDWLNGVREE